jgi:hypothetical protein
MSSESSYWKKIRAQRVPAEKPSEFRPDESIASMIMRPVTLYTCLS